MAGADDMACAASGSAHLPFDRHDKRVFDVGARANGPRVVVAKFYRSAQRTDAQILEEHQFTRELADQGIPAVAPLAIDGRTLHQRAGYRFALYPCLEQRRPDLGPRAAREHLGRCIGRMHAAGTAGAFTRRPLLTLEPPVEDPRCERCRRGEPTEQRAACERVLTQVLDGVRRCVRLAGSPRAIRLHGDLHPRNVIWVGAGSQVAPHLVDFDEACTGPAVQDLWMLLAGPRAARRAQLADLLTGYERSACFDRRELHLVEALRTLRLLRHAARGGAHSSEARRAAFPWQEPRCRWQELLVPLLAQVGAMREPPLDV